MTTALALLLSAVTAIAQQNLRTAYFLDGYTSKYKMNPALAPERSFISVPVLGNLSLGLESDLGLSNFLYPKGDELVTFMHPSLSDSQVLDSFKEHNRLNFNLDETIFAFGFRVGKSFSTIDLSIRADVGAGLPGSIFSFIRKGGSDGNTAWNFKDVHMRLDSHLELAYGYSRNINNLSLGARIKVLMGYARLDANVSDMNVTMDKNKWSVKAQGDGFMSDFGTLPVDKETGMIDFAGYELPEDFKGFLSPLQGKNMGFAMDLGVSWDFLKYFTASLSVNDLGFINWNNVTLAQMPSKAWDFNGFESLTGNEGNIGDEFSALGEDLLGLFNMKKTEEGVRKSVPVAATIHAAFEARMPFYERLSFGLLGTQKINGAYSWTEGRLSASLAPINCISLAASYAVSTYGNSYGGVINFHFPGFNLYAGVDSFKPLMNVTPKYYIPVNDWNTNLAVGLNISFGKPVGRFHKDKDSK